MKTVLKVEKLRLERGNVVILNVVSWQVRRREHWVILGANGSGKTSLLSALAGYLSATAGGIEVLGKRYGESDWRELRKRVGLVSSSIRQMMADDEPALETIISGRYAVIDLWGPVSNADRQRGWQLLRRVECEPLADRPWGVLSQGERQRILIGRALMARPALLILDEPCAGLDPVAREHFLQFLQRLRGATLVLVTHHVEEIMPVFTHVLVLKAGRVFAAGRKGAVMTTDRLQDAFGTPVKLRKIDKRYTLAVKPNARVVT